MAAKNNIRSIRFSDELAELVTRCVWELPQKEKQLASIQADIRREQERLYNLRRATEQLRLLEQDLERAKRDFELVARRAKAIGEAAEQDGQGT